MAEKKSAEKAPEKKQGLVDKFLHGDHAHESPVKKVSAEAGASDERRHQHPKFDKFKKGNR